MLITRIYFFRFIWNCVLLLNTFSTTIIIIAGHSLYDLFVSERGCILVVCTFIAVSRYMPLRGTYDWMNAWMIYYCLLWQVSEGTSWLQIPRCMSLNKIKMVVEFTAQLHFTQHPFCLFPGMQTNLRSFHCRQTQKSTSLEEYSLQLYRHMKKVNIWNFLLFI